MVKHLQKVMAAITLLMVLLNISAYAQRQSEGTITGRTVTSDMKPLPYATVALRDTRYATMADGNGNFLLMAPAGEYTLAITYAGYITLEKRVTVNAGSRLQMGNLAINAAANELREVVVSDIQRNKFSKKATGTVAKVPLADLENPQSYSVVNKDLMNEIIATDMPSALVGVPGVVANNSYNDSGLDFSTRGFRSSANFRNGLVTNMRTQTDITNIERVEILKGPSATLFGGMFSTYGGAVNIVTKRPFESFRGEMGYTTGSFGMNRLTVDVNTPLNANRTALARINAAGYTQKSFQDAGYAKGTALAASLLFKTGERTTVRFDGDFIAPEKTLNAYIRGSDQMKNENAGNFRKFFNRAFTSNDIGSKRTSMTAMAEIEHRFSNEWTSRTSYQHGESDERNSLFLVLTAVNDSVISRGIRPFDQLEITTDNIQQNFNGDFKIGNVRNRMVIGVDYLQQSNFTQAARYLTASTPKAVYSVFLPIDQVLINDNAQWQPMSRKVIQAKDNAMRSSTTGTMARDFDISAYASDVVNITDYIIANASIRVDRYEVKRTVTNGVVGKDNYVQTHWAPKFGLVVMPIKNKVSLFGNYSSGFTNNAPGIDATTGDVLRWKPTQAWQTEGGVKVDLLDGRLTSTVSYYNIKVKDLVNSLPDGTQQQNGTQRSKGFEMEVIANPVTGLNIVAGYGYSDARWLEYYSGKVNYAGQRINWTPEHVFNTWASYKIPYDAVKGLGVGLGVNYTGKSYLGVPNRVYVPSWTTINGSLFYDQPKYRVSLKLNNIADKQYWSFYGIPQMPRQFLANVLYKF